MTVDRHDIDAWREAALADAHGAERGIARALAAIATRDTALHAFVHVADDQARVRAQALDAARAAGTPPGPLFGVPVAVKDNLCTRGIETTAASRILRGFVPPYDATVVARLEAAGAVIIGKTNLDEFGMGSSTEHSAVGPTRNPWAHDRTPGGSSGGSAAAVAARLVPAALGSDTGGSVRQPAAFCGIVGLKPTYGRVSRYGLLAFASSLDQVGPMTRSSRDAAHVLQVLAGPDAHDATAADVPVPDYASALTGEAGHLRVGVPRRLLAHGVDDGVLAAFEQGLAALRCRGAQIVDCELPHAAQAIPVYYVLACAEASSNLARYDGVRYGLRVDDAQPSTLTAMYERTRDAGFGDEAKRRILLGTYVLSAGYYDAYYRQAQAVRTLIRRDYERAFAHVDAVAVPTTPTAAFRLGEKSREPLQMYLADVFTVGPSLAGLPALSVPCGRTAEGLPAGLQLTGRAWQEATLLRLGDVIEQESGWPMHGPGDDGSVDAA